MNTDRYGVMLVLCAPSGTGKSTLLSRLRAEFPRLAYSISYTTRAPRGEEQHGRDYFFVDRAEFDRLVSEDFFAEWAEVHENRYGTPRKLVLDMLGQGKDVLFDIDVQGAAQLKQVMDQGLYVFLLPPSRAELERRLRDRGTDSDEVIRKRLENARAELNEAEWFNCWVVNDDLEKAYGNLRAAYQAQTLRPATRPYLVSSLLEEWADEREEQ